jgi:hypothetical protein
VAAAPPPNAPEILEQFEQLFGELFRVTERVVPLVVERMYRGVVTEKRPVTIRRRVRCACAPRGCRLCDLVGWTVKTETLLVVVPEGITLGTRLRLPGKGDETLPTGPQDLIVEVVEVGPRAEELRAAQLAHETASDAHFNERRTAKALERKSAMRSALMLAIGLLVLGGIIAVSGGSEYLARTPTGQACARNADCRSNECLAIQRATPALPGSQLRFTTTDRHVCTERCETDSDCPATMECAGVHERLAGLSFAPSGPPDRRACAPREHELRDDTR